ncbi:MAG: hypothetical protein FWB93_01380 [Oscillospiraceae bacterium]|nr:hypothetical protein [Oscillospiraceae bacterium]
MKSLGMLQLFTKAIQVGSSITGLISLFLFIMRVIVGHYTIGEFLSGYWLVLVIFVVLVVCAVYLGKVVANKRAEAVAEQNRIERSYDNH